MVENKQIFDPAMFEAMGYQVGQALAAYMRGMSTGFADEMAAPQNVTETITNDEEQAAERDKTRIADCRACWCNTCAALEECENSREGWQPDGVRPRPCLGCFDNMRFMPREGEPTCGGYVEGAANYG